MVQDEEILAQLDRILRSNVFASAARSRQFLSYCVTSSLRGETSQLKETTIAVEVFLREATYDPKVDPIVRVHARRVREKLSVYYRTSGRGDPIAIDLPKGSYVAQFARIDPSDKLPAQAPPSIKDAEPHHAEGITTAQISPIAASEIFPLQVIAPAARVPRSGTLIMIAVAALLIVASVILVLKSKTKGDARTVASPPSLVPVDAFLPNASDVAWSADHRSVAFLLTDAKHRSFVYTMKLGQDGTPHRLTKGTRIEYRPVWSADGRKIAFVRMLDDVHFVLVCVQLSTGEEAKTGPFTAFLQAHWYHPALDWSPDGKYLLTSDQVSPDVPVRLILLRLQDGARIFLTSPPVGSAGDVDGRFSPDGRHVAFHRGGLGDLYILNLNGENATQVRQLTFDNRGVHGMSFTPDGSSILFGTDRSLNDVFSIYQISVTGGDPLPVTPTGFSALDPAMVDHDEVVFRHEDIAAEIVEQQPGAGSASQLFTGNEVDQQPSYSPDGESVAFISTRSGTEEVWRYRRGETGPVQLTHFAGGGFFFTPHWSPSGDQITFGYRDNGETNVFVLNLKSFGVTRLTHTHGRDFNPVFSRDGTHIFFSSNADGSPRLWRIAADGKRDAEPLFTRALSSFAASYDGRWLYYLDGDEPLRLYRLNLLTGATAEILHTEARPAFTNSLVVTREAIYMAVSESNGPIRITRIDPDSLQGRTAWLLPTSEGAVPFVMGGFDVAPDGGRLLTTHITRRNVTMFRTKVIQGQPNGR